MQPGSGSADPQLWDRVRARDANAFAELYRRHSGRVHAHLLQRTGTVEAEDLTAEVFVVAWRKNADIHFDEEAGMLPWLLVCANNLLRNQERSLRRARLLLDRVPPGPTAAPDIADEVTDTDERRRARLAVRAVLDRLADGDRDIIQLCVIQGLSPAAVAGVTGRPAGTVRSQLSRALARARSLYETNSGFAASTSIGETP